MTVKPTTYSHAVLRSHHPNTMTNMNPSNFTIHPSSSLSYSSLFFLSGGVFFMPEIQMLELLLAVLVFVIMRSLRQRNHQGLPNWPLVGMLPSLVVGLQKDLYEWISEVLNRKNGTFMFRGPWFTNLNCVVTSDPRNLEHLLKTKFTNFPKGEYFRNTVSDLLGDGIFNADDEIWQRQRKTTSIEFHSAKFRNMTTDSLKELVHTRLLPVLEESVKQPAPIDLQDILLRLTFDNVCMIAFGVDPGCLRPGLPEIPFAQAFEAATEATLMRFVTPTLIWQAMRYFNTGSERILLTVFMGLKDEQGRPFSDKFLRDICVNFILAGRDTSSVALSWFFWLDLQARGGEEDGISPGSSFRGFKALSLSASRPQGVMKVSPKTQGIAKHTFYGFNEANASVSKEQHTRT